MRSSRSPREHVANVVSTHGALTRAVAEASQLMSANGRGEYAAHLDVHRAELNVAIGELAMWLNSFRDWGHVDPADGIHPSPSQASPGRRSNPFEVELLAARETLKSLRARLLTDLAAARSALDLAGLPSGELTAYRRTVRLWAGEAIDVVTAVHRLTLADRCIRRLGQLGTGGRDGAEVLRQWMDDLEAVDREGELALAESCGYGELVQWYRAQAV